MPKWTKTQLKTVSSKYKKRPLNNAARVYGIPVSTLHNHVKAERPTILIYGEKREIVSGTAKITSGLQIHCLCQKENPSLIKIMFILHAFNKNLTMTMTSVLEVN